MKIKKIACLILALIIVATICGCGEKGITILPAPYDSETKYDITVSGKVAKSGDYTLYLDENLGFPILTKDGTSKKWDSSLAGSFVASSVIVDLYYEEYESFITVNSVDAVTMGRVKTEEITDGVRVTYFFDEYKLSIPVYYKVNENGLTVKVDPSEITENDYTVISVAVSPYLCNVKNEKSDDRYLFVPSGSGALMYTDNRGVARKYREEVYGKDLASENKWQYNNTSQINLPVFGAVDGDEAIYGIITSGASSSAIGATAGDRVLGYSSVYPIFNVRAYNTVQVNIGGVTGLKDFIRLANKRNTEIFEVQYTILSGDNASYNGIASAYRDYLGLEDGVKNKPLNLTMLGGVMADRSALGIPYTTFSASTTISQAKDMISEIYETNKAEMNIRLYGFGKTGLTVDKLAGDFKVNRKTGTKSQIKDFKAFCDEINSDLFIDYDVLHFVNSGNGYSKRNDVALDTTDYRVKRYAFDISLRGVDTTQRGRYLLSRDRISSAVNDAVSSAKKYGFTGVSLDTLGRMAYSDFSDLQYYGKGKMNETVSQALSAAVESDVKLLTKSSNDYAAKLSDYIDSIPSISSNTDAIDIDIPFYGIVFSGCKENSVAVNISSEPEKRFLDAIKTGSGLSFVLAYDVNSDVIASVHSAYIAADYESAKNDINNYYAQAKDFLNSVSGVSVKAYEILEKGVSKTVFDNGVTVYVNQTTEDVVCEKNTVKAMSFKVR